MRLVIIISVMLAVITTAVYWKTGNHDFFGIDDPSYVTENVHITNGLSANNIV